MKKRKREPDAGLEIRASYGPGDVEMHVWGEEEDIGGAIVAMMLESAWFRDIILNCARAVESEGQVRRLRNETGQMPKLN